LLPAPIMKKSHAFGLSLATTLLFGTVTVSADSPETTTYSAQSVPALVPLPSDVTDGKLIQSPEGSVIGTVSHVVADNPKTEPAYVLVATESGTTAIPYWAIHHFLRDAHLVMERSLLASAPRVDNSQLGNSSDATWRKQADQYWHPYH
jgi:hypothetical protein